MKTHEDIVTLARMQATLAHHGQVRKFTGEPYVVHPERVEQAVAARGYGPVVQAAALLHDVPEDTPIKRVELALAGIPAAVLDLVDVLTHREGENYADYIKRVAQHPVALQVKLADLEDNMRDLKEGTLKDKYRLAHLYLTERA